MQVTPTGIPDVLLIALDPRVDERGMFVERFNEETFARHGLPTRFRQDNFARSKGGVLRGLHFQLDRPQGKLVGCTRGRTYTVVLDLRRGSPTFARWTAVELSEERAEQLWIPPGFAHGYCTLAEVVDVVYKCSDVYSPGDDHGIAWDDPDLAITWPLADPILSPRDRELPRMREFADRLPLYAGA